jgi:hypothetical protein
MWAGWVVAAIALAATAFMLRFLIALLREGAPSVCYWVVPVREEPQLEKEKYAKEERVSGLITLDVRPASYGLGWSSIHPSRGYIFGEHRR